MADLGTLTRHLTELRRDVVYALRRLAKSPGFAFVGIVSLSLGIGVCSVYFSEINSLLRPLPGARDPEALVALDAPVSYPYFERYRDQRGVAVAATAFLGPVPFGVAVQDRDTAKERVFGHLVSPEYFSTLGVQPALGRFFRTDEEKPGTAPVVVVSDRFWRTRLHSDPRVVGRTLGLNGKVAIIVGVGPKGFLGVWPLAPADLFVPVTSGASIAPELGDAPPRRDLVAAMYPLENRELAPQAGGDALHNRNLAIFRVILRLASGVKLPAAEAALDAVTKHLDEQGPEGQRGRKGRQVHLMGAGTVVPVPPAQRFATYAFVAILLGLILSLACTNLANLLLARGSERRKEIAIRLSLGASRSRLIRQLLTESVILAIAGGCGGLLFAYWLTNVISTMKVPIPFPVQLDLRPDLRVLLITLALAVCVGVAFGLVPALAATSPDVALALKEGAVAPPRRYRRFGLRNLLVTWQVAGSLMLLMVTGFIVLGFGNTSHIDPGFDTQNLYLLQLDPAHDGYSPDQSAKLFEKLPERLSRLAAVRAFTIAEAVPFGDLIARPNARFAAQRTGGEVLSSVVRQRIGASYFATLGVPLVTGHEFTQRDEVETRAPDAARPALVNQTASRELFGNAGPLGQRIHEGRQNYSVIGVARDLKPGFLGAKPVATVFLTLEPSQGATIMIRGTAGLNAAAAVRNEVAAIDAHLTLFNVRSMREHLGQFTGYFQFVTTIYGGIGLFGLILASIGLAGVTAYSVAQRRKEIGIRMALGARNSQVLRLVMKEGAVLVAAGTLLGFGGAFAISRALSAMTADLARALGDGTHNPFLLIGAPLLLASLAMLACYLPARGATRIDPLTALREE